MGGQRGAGYWKERARALEAANRRLHERLMALATVLPPDWLDLVEGLEPPSRITERDPIDPAEAAPEPTPSHVGIELLRLWEKTAPPEND